MLLARGLFCLLPGFCIFVRRDCMHSFLGICDIHQRLKVKLCLGCINFC